MGGARIRVLLVEDDSDDAMLVQEMLAESTGAQFEVVLAERLSAATRLLTDSHFDLVLLDLSLPDRQGLSTLAGVRTAAPRVPIVVLTGLADEDLAMKALHSGAQDYLVKGEDTVGSLSRSIRYAIERQRLEHTLEQSLQWEQQSWAQQQAKRDYRHYLAMSRDAHDDLPGPDEATLDAWRQDYMNLVFCFAHADSTSQPRPARDLHRLAQHLAGVRARTRDVVRLHLNVLSEFSKQAEPADQQTFLGEARLVLIELLGDLADTYLAAARAASAGLR